MNEIVQLQSITQAVMYFAAFKLKAIPEPIYADESCVSLELADNLSKVVWVERYVIACDSVIYMTDHRNRMKVKGELYIIYVLYLCYLIKESVKEGYEVFIRTLTLLLYLATEYPRPQFLQGIALSATIFSFFYSKEISNDFMQQGGFAKLNEYLLERDTLKTFSDIEELEDESGELRRDIFIRLNSNTSRLKVHLSKNFNASDIESHWPSVQMLRDILVSGSGSIKEMVGGVEMKLQPPIITSEISSIPGEDSQRPKNSGQNKIERTLQGLSSSQSTAVIHRQVMKHVREFYEKCRKMEQLLDFIFSETSNEGEQT